MMAKTLVLVLLAILQLPGSPLTGRVVDPADNPVPGATVQVVRSGVSGRTVTDPSGRFRLEGLAGGAYDMTVSLAGFRTQRLTVRVDPSAPRDLKVQLAVGTLTEILWVVPAPAEAYRRAAAIAHVRIERTHPYGSCGDTMAVTARHDASVLRVFKGQLPAAIQLDQEAAGRCRQWVEWIEGIDAPYRAGEEYVVFLTEGADGFGRLAGPGLTFRVSGDLVNLRGFDGVMGPISLNEFADRMARLSR
jgi:hypothetical protein